MTKGKRSGKERGQGTEEKTAYREEYFVKKDQKSANGGRGSGDREEQKN